MTLRWFHRVAGIAVAIPLTLTALSGALLLLRDPYYRARFPDLARPVTAWQADLRAATLERIDALFLPATPRVVKFPRERFNAFHVYLTDGSEALVDPITATVLDRWEWHDRPMPWLFELHAHLLAGDVGKTVNGAAAVGAILLALSGALVWWPRRRAMPAGRVIPARLSPGDLLRSHAGTGILAALPLLLFTATGAGIVFYGPVSKAMGGIFDRRPSLEPTAVVVPRTAAPRPWRDILAAADGAFDGTTPAMLSPGTSKNAVVTFRTRLPGEWHPNGRSYVLVNPYDARVVQAIDARTQGAGTRAMHALYPIHAARTGGAVMTAIAGITSLALAWLGVGGAWLFVCRWVRASAATRGPSVPRLQQEVAWRRGREVSPHGGVEPGQRRSARSSAAR